MNFPAEDSRDPGDVLRSDLGIPYGPGRPGGLRGMIFFGPGIAARTHVALSRFQFEFDLRCEIIIER